VLEDDMKAVAATGERGVMDLMAATHVGNTTDEFAAIVTEWIATARHPKFNRPYTDLVYQPMLELLTYLRANSFKTYIVSGGGVEFMRPWVERVYGIPPEQVVGSRAKVKYELRGDTPVLVRLPEIDLIDDKAGKPVGIHQVIGRRPLAAFGNSDGDFEMLEWTTSAKGPRFGLIVHHTDAEREWAYDRTSHIGTLARGLDEAPTRGWIVVDMKKDWKVIYPFQKRVAQEKESDMADEKRLHRARGIGSPRAVPGVVQGVPAAPEARLLLHRPGASTDAGGRQRRRTLNIEPSGAGQSATPGALTRTRCRMRSAILPDRSTVAQHHRQHRERQ
jgi:haloacid dehalogenase-like hydrolase